MSGKPEQTDPSMEDILASIRRILNEEDQPPPDVRQAAPEPKRDEDVLVLEPSMLVGGPEPASGTLPQSPGEPPIEIEMEKPEQALVGPEAARAAAASVAGLVRTLASERTTAVRPAGPTIEDLVREEIRPLLTEWLNTHLPPIVERLVRAEIERVVSRALS